MITNRKYFVVASKTIIILNILLLFCFILLVIASQFTCTWKTAMRTTYFTKTKQTLDIPESYLPIILLPVFGKLFLKYRFSRICRILIHHKIPFLNPSLTSLLNMLHFINKVFNFIPMVLKTKKSVGTLSHLLNFT